MTPEPNPRAPQRFGRAGRALLCVGLVYHLAAITVANVPSASDLDRALHAPFDAYTTLAGLSQTWDMFTTIPHYLDLEAELRARHADGREMGHGPMLPGLGLQRKTLRIHGFFLRLVLATPFNDSYRRRYFDAACHEVERRLGARPQSVALTLTGLRIRPLQAIRRDRRIADFEVHRSEEHPCGP